MKTQPIEALSVLGFVVALISFFTIVIPEWSQGAGGLVMANLVAHWYVLAWMLVATVVVRTVGIRQTVAMFFSGFFLATTVSWLFTRPLLNWFGENDMTVAVWVPLVEELAKAIPLVLFLWLYSRRSGQSHGVSELMMLGFAVGGGFAVYEDLLWNRTMASWDESVFGSFGEPWGAVFPTFFTGYGDLLIVHAGWTAIVGLGLALASIYRRRRILALCFAIAPLALVTLDHAALNMRGGFAPVVNALTLNNVLPLVVLVLGFPLAIVYDVLRRRHRPPALPVPGRALYRVGLRTGGDVWRVIINVLALGHYRRGWTAAAYDRASVLGRGDDDARLAAWYRVVVPPARVAESASE
ncbi:PrsW family glutamic-type intramembrane protease [Demequina muriae]|uniref:PrsW family glutamic-type intramembrane protease n=1 Tax=Demequina muriae TaxID=3051664 RepID=A0ABT8GE45_9MICO|nr:PrsW family glutamic-type intramembrane protease [Demequina sp. EGI L300058]MDN4479698.1 PrsW family glutamic-type intramembrane protease [Demequina sp. EGI L300058]